MNELEQLWNTVVANAIEAGEIVLPVDFATEGFRTVFEPQQGPVYDRPCPKTQEFIEWLLEDQSVN